MATQYTDSDYTDNDFIDNDFTDDHFTDNDFVDDDFRDNDFTDNDDGDWGELQLITNEDNLITAESTQQAPSIQQVHRQQCWQCPECNTINNIRQCIREHGSKCVGCQNQCYIESQTETIIQNKYHSTNEFYLLQMEQLWQCESCFTVNEKSSPNCMECDKPSRMTIIRRKIKKFTPRQKHKHLLKGFVRELGNYFHKLPTIYSDLSQLILDFYEVNNDYIFSNVKCMSNTLALSLKVGDKLDHRDRYTGKFKVAEVTEIDTKNDKCKFKFKSNDFSGLFGSTFTLSTTWYDYKKDPLKFAEAGAVTSRPAHRLKKIKVGDRVDINPDKMRNGWKHGKIKEMDPESGQVKVGYKRNDTAKTCWTHLDNEEEIAEFGSMTGKTEKTVLDLLLSNADKGERANVDLGNQW